MIKKILLTAFIILIALFFIENPSIFGEFFSFSKDKIKNIGEITANAVTDLNSSSNISVSAGVEANLIKR